MRRLRHRHLQAGADSPAIHAARLPDRLRLLPRRRPLRPQRTTRPGDSWQAEPGDIVLFDFNGDGVADHTEIVTGYHGGELFTIGGNSGPSNVDGYHGQGGVHRHRWPAPAGQGNNQILAVIDTAKVVRFGGPAHLTQRRHPAAGQPRQLDAQVADDAPAPTSAPSSRR